MKLSTALLSAALISATVSQAQVGFTTNIYPGAGDDTLRVADFNGDGKADLLGFSYFYGAHIYLNNGNGGFNLPVTLSGGQSYGSVYDAQVADINGDGAPDIVACTTQPSAPTPYNLVVFLNDGRGAFHVGQTIPLSYPCYSLLIGDVNHDGHPDVVTRGYLSSQASSAPNNIFQTFFGDPNGYLGNPVTVQNVNLDSPADGSAYTYCVSLNFTGGNFYLDGQFSLIVNTLCFQNTNNSAPVAGTTFVAHGQGNGQFTFTESRLDPVALTGGITSEVDQDSLLDAAFYTLNPNQSTTSYHSDLYYSENNGGGNFTYNLLTGAIKAPTPFQIAGVAVGDLTGDGTNDIASTFATQPNTSPNGYISPYISILAGSKSGTFTESQHWLVDPTATNVGNLVAADFNGDGKLDLATMVTDPNFRSSLYIYTNHTGTAGCLPSNPGVKVCQPALGAAALSPVTISAGAVAQSGYITALRFYIDNVAVYTAYNPDKSTSFQATHAVPINPGSHHLVVVAYQSTGAALTSSEDFSVSVNNNCYPATPGAEICSPVPNSTVNSPVQISSGATPASGQITAIAIYVDNVEQSIANNVTQSKSFANVQTLSIAPGTHHLVVVAYQSTGGAYTAGEWITVP